MARQCELMVELLPWDPVPVTAVEPAMPVDLSFVPLLETDDLDAELDGM